MPEGTWIAEAMKEIGALSKPDVKPEPKAETEKAKPVNRKVAMAKAAMAARKKKLGSKGEKQGK